MDYLPHDLDTYYIVIDHLKFFFFQMSTTRMDRDSIRKY